MQTWEYRTFYLFHHSQEIWKVREIDGVEQPDWKKQEGHSSLTVFCNRQSREGWELVAASQDDSFVNYTLFFRHPLT